MPSDLDKLQQSPRHLARWQQAQQELLTGRPEAALDAYRSLLNIFPASPACGLNWDWRR